VESLVLSTIKLGDINTGMDRLAEDQAVRQIIDFGSFRHAGEYAAIPVGQGSYDALGATAAIQAGVTDAVFMAAQRGRVGSPRASQAGPLFLSLGNAVLAAAMVSKAALVGFALAGKGFGLAMSSLRTIVQERAPDNSRGRIMAVWLIGFVGSRPLACHHPGWRSRLVVSTCFFHDRCGRGASGCPLVSTLQVGTVSGVTHCAAAVSELRAESSATSPAYLPPTCSDHHAGVGERLQSLRPTPGMV
jgi:hypothetical protein